MDLFTFFCFLNIIVWVMWPALLNYFDTKFYHDLRKCVGCLSPPGIVFPIVWIPLYAAISVSGCYHILSASSSSLTVLWISTMSLYIANITLNHRWPNLFFKQKRFWHAFINISIVFASAVAVEVLYAIDGHWTSFWWYLAYPIWLAYALFLNGAWASKCKEVTKPLAKKK